MELEITNEIVKAYSEVSDDKHGYVSVCGLNSSIIFHADVKEVVKMSIAKVDLAKTFAFRAPVEVLQNVIQLGKLEFEFKKINDSSSIIEMKHYNISNNIDINIVIPYETCIAQDQIVEIYKAMSSDNTKYIEDLSCFRKAIAMCRPNSKNTPISGAQIRDNKICVIGNGYYAEAPDYTGLQVIIPISTLKYLNSFCSGLNRVKYCNLAGYNYIMTGSSCIGWRRMRTEKFEYSLDIKKLFAFDVEHLKGIVNSIVSSVNYCLLSVQRGCIEISTSSAILQIPITIHNLDNTEDLTDFKINTHLFFSLIKGFKGVVTMGFCNKSLVLINDNVTYIIGRTV